ncbi:MAG: gamma-glutamyl-gamma-aminobutyrate hydrolase [Phototrophicales bacterium]|nr:MAG: gamma-glutamyl-gamma-aminobutyrate hydrolase [Phototrophicales bacterium]
MNLPLIGLTTTHVADDAGRLRESLSYEYTEAVVQAGGVPILIPLSTLQSEEDTVALRAVYERLDGVIIPGGGDIHPEFYGETVHPTSRGISTLRDSVEVQLVRWAYEDDKPLFGICRGHQMINVALGGTLHHDVKALQGQSAFINHDANAVHERELLMHTVSVDSSSRLFKALGAASNSVAVNSLHHQAVNRLSSELMVSALADDGIIEGVEAPKARFFMGVQWHPEALVRNVPQMAQLFRTFVAACIEKPVLIAR